LAATAFAFVNLKLRLHTGPVNFRNLRALLLGLPLVIYCALPTRNFYWDGVAFAIAIEKRQPAASLFYPSHLLYMSWGSWLYGLATAAGIHTRALFAMQAANGVLAGLSVILFYRSLRQWGVPAGLGTAGALVFAFSATWWKFAGDANAYVPAIFLLLCANLLLANRRTTVLAGCAHAGAMLFHELAIFFLPAALPSLRKNRGLLAAYTAAAVVPVAIAYAAAHRAISRISAVPRFFSWVTLHSPDSGFSFQPFANALLSLRGTLRLFFGGRVGDAADGGLSRAALLALAVAAVAFLVATWRAVRAIEVASPPVSAVVWAGVYVAFLLFWMPQNTFYRLFYLPAAIAIALTMLRQAPRAAMAVGLFVPVLLLWNLAFAIYPQSRAESNAPYRFALAQTKRWPPGTPIAFHIFHPDLWTISYFNQQAAWIGMTDADTGLLERNLAEARNEGRTLWVEQTAYDLVESGSGGRQWLAAHEDPANLIEFHDAKHEFRFHCMR
jgi:hypothetical protein